MLNLTTTLACAVRGNSRYHIMIEKQEPMSLTNFKVAYRTYAEIKVSDSMFQAMWILLANQREPIYDLDNTV